MKKATISTAAAKELLGTGKVWVFNNGSPVKAELNIREGDIVVVDNGVIFNVVASEEKSGGAA